MSINGRVIGWLNEHLIGRSFVVFINALAVHAPTGKHVNLENSTDFRERLERLIEFDQDPERFRGIHLH